MNPDFLAQTRSAYEHLYDLIYLRTHALIAFLPSAPKNNSNGQAWMLHHTLIDAIHQLDPGPNAPVFSREWRRYRLLARHFLDGIDPQELARELNISRRQYYREYNLAIEALADVLAALLSIKVTENPDELLFRAATPSTPLHTEPLLSEAAPLGDSQCTFNLLETVQGGVQILDEIFVYQHISIELGIPANMPAVAASSGLLRQILLNMLGFLANQISNQAISIQAEGDADWVNVVLSISAHQTIFNPEQRPWEEMALLEDLEIHFDPQRPEQIFRLRLPVAGIRRVLAIDDNADILQLYQRFLSAHGYQMIAETDPQRAMELAARIKPDIILLDLMMPGVDGWDVLQTLAHTPETGSIPVIVCSILPQKELAHSLGAAAFLQKPITETILIQAIQALSCQPD